MIKRQNKLAGILALGVVMLALTGCEKEGPAEKAGKEIDKAINNAGSQIESIGKELEGALK